MVDEWNTPLIVKVAFTGLSAALLMYIYMYAWPADYMKEKVDRVFIHRLYCYNRNQSSVLCRA
ncbi:hypothetical protein K0M31_002125 [Melipona bicolor]|uniref:Uncharacterized protein n=1 Tax=Melipona bicolor TaxID=60889 RepID=A0AA40KYW5_9HYME|nr:hypothetical protein K0M31_002125 [Melipona bicolor]